MQGDACWEAAKNLAGYNMTSGILSSTKEAITLEKDLGVNVDADLSFKNVQIQITKANKFLGIIKRTFGYIDNITPPHLYKAKVRPHLKYCNAVWHFKWKKELELESYSKPLSLFHH